MTMAVTITCENLKPEVCVFILMKVLNVIQYLFNEGIAFVPTDREIFLNRDSILIGEKLTLLPDPC